MHSLLAVSSKQAELLCSTLFRKGLRTPERWRTWGKVNHYITEIPSCLANPMDGGAWWAAVHGVAQSRTQLSDFTFTFHFHTLEKEMATHASVLAWKIPWVEEPGRLQSMGSRRVGHDWATSLSLFTFHFHALEKEMATHSSVIAWRIPGTGEPGRLQSMG